jgi:hypothetical protein
MNKIETKTETRNEKSDAKETREGFQVREEAPRALVVSEFERAPLTDVNFGF